jgi:hypothetical protein
VLLDTSGPDTVIGRVRVLLLLAVLHGLVPGLREVVESVVHYASTGHLAHSPGETDLGHQGPEHSCGVTLHACGCCAGQPVLDELASASFPQDPPTPSRVRQGPLEIRERAPERPFRPPIA